MLTARGEEVERVRGLSVGADDYVVKPFSVPELMARVRALLRRSRPERIAERLVAGDLDLDRETRRVRRGSRDVHLGPTEFRLLEYLLERPGRVFSRAQLLDGVWGQSVEIDERTVDVHVGRLRKALSRGRERDPIRTVRGTGYSFDETFGKSRGVEAPAPDRGAERARTRSSGRLARDAGADCGRARGGDPASADRRACRDGRNRARARRRRAAIAEIRRVGSPSGQRHIASFRSTIVTRRDIGTTTSSSMRMGWVSTSVSGPRHRQRGVAAYDASPAAADAAAEDRGDICERGAPLRGVGRRTRRGAGEGVDGEGEDVLARPARPRR